MSFQVAAFYRFVALPDFRELKAPLLSFCAGLGIKGTILLAGEGINGTVAGTQAAIEALLAEFATGPLFSGRLAGIDVKFSSAAEMPFRRLKVRLKREIVRLGRAEVDPTKRVGTYVAPEDWNALISRPDMVVIDTRNHFEVEMGTFKGALDPKTSSFSEFPAFVARELDASSTRKVAMFCTGGIRCEKASAYMLAAGFEEVFHLKGGILKYLETVPAEQSLWQGDCFVFDERIAVGHGLEERGPSALQPVAGLEDPADDTEADRQHQQRHRQADADTDV